MAKHAPLHLKMKSWKMRNSKCEAAALTHKGGHWCLAHPLEEGLRAQNSSGPWLPLISRSGPPSCGRDRDREADRTLPSPPSCCRALSVAAWAPSQAGDLLVSKSSSAPCSPDSMRSSPPAACGVYVSQTVKSELAESMVPPTLALTRALKRSSLNWLNQLWL